MNYIVLIGAAIFGFWIVNFLISQYPGPAQRPGSPRPTPPSGNVPDPLAWACQVLQLGWPTDLLTAEAAYLRRKNELSDANLMGQQGSAREAARRQLAEVEDAYEILRQQLGAPGIRR